MFMKKFLFFSLTIVTAIMLASCEKAAINNSPYDPPPVSPEIKTAVSVEKAQSVASHFIASQAQSFTKNSEISVKNIDEIKSDNGRTLMYIINYAPEGFVIVSATKDYYPILAFSDKGNYSVEKSEIANRMWLDKTKIAVTQSADLSDSIKLGMRTLWSSYSEGVAAKANGNAVTKAPGWDELSPMEQAFQLRIAELQAELGDGFHFHRLSDIFELGEFPDDYGAYLHYCQMAREVESPLEYTIVGISGGQVASTIGPLLSTQWNQTNTFNSLCDNPPGEAAGCVPIAIAQIMKYYEYPTNYDWANMHNIVATEPTRILIRDIQRLSGQQASENDTKNTLRHYGYNVSSHGYNQQSTNDEIASLRPIIMLGSDNQIDEHHAWVCDGTRNIRYSSGYFIEFYVYGEYTSLEYAPSKEELINVSSPITYYLHNNWGWGVNSTDPNGWYLTTDVSTSHGNFTDRTCLFISL